MSRNPDPRNTPLADVSAVSHSGLDLVASVSSALLEVRPEDPGPGLTRLLASLVDVLGSGSASLYRLGPDGVVERLARYGEFVAPLSSYRLELFPAMAQQVMDGKWTWFRTADMGAEAEVARGMLESIGIRAGLVVPMTSMGQLWGVMAFWWGSEHPVPETVPEALMPISAVIAQTMRWLDAEIERRRITEWFRLYSEASSEAIVVHEGGVFVDANEPALRMLRADRREQLLGMRVLDLAEPHEHERLAARIARGEEGRLEARAIRLDGTVFDCEIEARQAVVDGRAYRLLVVRDIEQRIRDRALRGRALQSQRLESLGLLASGIAHDFNNLLVGILGHAELAELRGDVSPATSESLEQIRQATLKAAGLTRQLLAYAGQAPIEVQSADLDDRVEELMPLLLMARRGRVKVEVELDGDLPAIPIDGPQIDQVVMNLVTNAIEAVGERGTVWVRTALAEGDGRTAVVLEVEDDGPGMDENTRERVFDPFFSTREEGRGLGLAAVHGIVRQHGGWVEVVSEPGAGAVFRVFLPGDAEPGAPENTEPVRRVEASPRVLVVDDEPSVRRIAREMLEVSGFLVDEATDGAAALHRLLPGTVPYSAVILDLNMPGIGGEEVYARLRAHHVELPVVICSGAPDPRRFEHDPRVSVVFKPFTREQLVRSLVGLIAP